MAAFTTFSEEALQRYLVMFDRGELAHWQAIEGGIENSNYMLALERHDRTESFILTIMEHHGFDEVPFFTRLLAHLSYYGLPVAAPVQTMDGMTSTIFCGKPTLLFPRLAGEHTEHPDTDACRAIGAFMAEAHQVLQALPLARDNPYSPDWMHDSLHNSQADASTRQLIAEIIEEYEALESLDLPRGLIHGDLFRDNALFSNGSLSGVIDFYHACHDLLILDLAVAINDWCLNETGTIDEAKRDALVAGYERIRELESLERESLPAMQRVSAARFALTRYESGDPPLKDPDEMIHLARALGAGQSDR